MSQLAAIALVALTIGPPIWIYANPPPRRRPAAPEEVYMALKADPNGGWGGAPYWQVCRKDDPGAMRYVRDVK